MKTKNTKKITTISTKDMIQALLMAIASTMVFVLLLFAYFSKDKYSIKNIQNSININLVKDAVINQNAVSRIKSASDIINILELSLMNISLNYTFVVTSLPNNGFLHSLVITPSEGIEAFKFTSNLLKNDYTNVDINDSCTSSNNSDCFMIIGLDSYPYKVPNLKETISSNPSSSTILPLNH